MIVWYLGRILIKNCKLYILIAVYIYKLRSVISLFKTFSGVSTEHFWNLINLQIKYNRCLCKCKKCRKYDSNISNKTIILHNIFIICIIYMYNKYIIHHWSLYFLKYLIHEYTMRYYLFQCIQLNVYRTNNNIIYSIGRPRGLHLNVHDFFLYLIIFYDIHGKL